MTFAKGRPVTPRQEAGSAPGDRSENRLELTIRPYLRPRVLSRSDRATVVRYLASTPIMGLPSTGACTRLLARFVIVATILLGSSRGARSAPPDVTSLFPAGGQVGTTATVTIQGKLGDGVCQVWSSVPGVVVTCPEKPGPVTVHIGPHVEPGICWLRFFNADGATGLKPFIVGASSEIVEMEPNDEASKAPPLPTLPVVVNGQHGKNGDSDSFAVYLRRGQVLVASLMANRVLGSPQDAVLQILGPDGFVLEQNEDDQGLDPQLAFPAPTDGIYTLRTWAFPAAPDSSIRLFGSPACVYRLTVTTGPFVDDVQPAALRSGEEHRVRLHGWNLPADEVSVVAPASALDQRFEWSLAGWSHRLPATVLVQPYSGLIEHEPNDASHPQNLTLPVSVSGRIDQPRDVDAYQFAGKKGQRLRFEVLARDRGSPLDPLLRILDGTGKVLKEADDDGKQSADPDFEFTVPADSDFRVAVTDRFLHHGDRFAYLLSITEPQPDYSLSVAADTFTVSPGHELEIPVTVVRTSGFSGAIRVLVRDLPVGVTAEAVVSEGKGDSSKGVKLKLKGDGQQAYSGRIQIVGRAENSLQSERLAAFSMKPIQSETSQLWITVLKKP